MEQLFLEDLKELDEAGVKAHLAMHYGKESFETDLALAQQLDDYDILVAYESVGSWGCDSSSYFLLRKKDSGVLYEVRGSHCSCYGFEGQFTPEETTVEYLKSDNFHFYCGGYDDNETANQTAVAEYMRNLAL